MHTSTGQQTHLTQPDCAPRYEQPRSCAWCGARRQDDRFRGLGGRSFGNSASRRDRKLERFCTACSSYARVARLPVKNCLIDAAHAGFACQWATSCSQSPQAVKRERDGHQAQKRQPRSNRRVKADQEDEVVPPGFLVAHALKLRCLRNVGRCWRLPGRDITNWHFYGHQQPSASGYDHYCKHCWNNAAVPGGDSEPVRAGEDSSSSSSVA